MQPEGYSGAVGMRIQSSAVPAVPELPVPGSGARFPVPVPLAVRVSFWDNVWPTSQFD